LEELRELASLVALNYSDIGDYDPKVRTTALQVMKRQMVISEVIVRYTLVDEFLSTALCHYFFGKKRSQRLWKTKKFRNFNYYVVEILSLNEKFRFFKEVAKVPKGVAENVERLVALRNGLAHAYFPENLRTAKRLSPMRSGVWSYKGKDIFTLDGMKAFVEDAASVLDSLGESIWL
jgi:hypothetical protein